MDNRWDCNALTDRGEERQQQEVLLSQERLIYINCTGLWGSGWSSPRGAWGLPTGRLWCEPWLCLLIMSMVFNFLICRLSTRLHTIWGGYDSCARNRHRRPMHWAHWLSHGRQWIDWAAIILTLKPLRVAKHLFHEWYRDTIWSRGLVRVPVIMHNRLGSVLIGRA